VPSAETARLFFAVWPAPAVQRSLGEAAERLQRACGGRAMPARNIHLTLVFLGDVPYGRTAALGALAARIDAAPFELRLDRTAYWRHNRIVWAGTAHCPPALARLVEQLEEGLSAQGCSFDRRRYVPHVTLVRNARRAPPAGLPCQVDWPVTRFALIESVAHERGRIYQVRQEWPLAA
jgi:RNA 2',3'-cyclic 3'-phosphodiesterase